MSATSPDIGAEAAWPTAATGRMNRMYRWQRHIYDLTRRYYLLGRDRLIVRLEPAAGATVLEIGCGTGRNLVHAAMLFPEAQFFGIDVSTEMLASASQAILCRGMTDRIRISHGDGTAFDPQALFGVAAFDRIMISYSLSMIPDWRRAIEAATQRLAPGGRLHIVDFGNQERMPDLARAALLRWLALFDVTPRDDLACELSAMASGTGADLNFERPYLGYAQYAVLRLPLGPKAP
ncbi:MAG TPA: class I SAM-dependent methyltransferase [Bradyrhizobium sp.]|jgi:S-adenosylmethionine-diacylgycerolhomoserine-N-methlytransferase|uniref:class I SAM-dependent methyltransferase n=1 Tax=Bradyrhizobium sp. TaxID=376 RepID=UPI002C20772F|nr:class I SAM-dependent methyltransferase [Bradyrhizobium sp.]HTB02397.1 class I SAM-dependent methyltransferase [Bradyrhizobium sp.]